MEMNMEILEKIIMNEFGTLKDIGNHLKYFALCTAKDGYEYYWYVNKNGLEFVYDVDGNKKEIENTIDFFF